MRGINWTHTDDATAHAHCPPLPLTGRFRSTGPDFLARGFYTLKGWSSGLGGALASALTVLRLR